MDYLLHLKKTQLLKAALGIILLHLPLSAGEEIAKSEESLSLLSAPPSKGGKPLQTLPEEKVEHNTPSLNDAPLNKDSYTINFDNISMIEYIKFVSKITNQNFIFDETELQFNVTIVSEDPVTPRNIMSILIQILRSRNLSVLEQDSNLLITSVKNINQIAKVVSGDLPDDSVDNSPLVTRVFRIKNANLGTVASIIKPMMSEAALVEISAETKQLIVTDITTNVDKISSLLASLDTPHTSLEIDSYVSKNIDSIQLIATANLLIAPFAEGNPVIFVPQTGTRTIFIVSTPHLIERALTILEDLDTVTEASESGPMPQLYIYPLKNTSGEDFLSALQSVKEELKGSNPSLLEMLSNAKYIPESRSVIFMGSPEHLDRAKELAPTLDIVPNAEASSNRTFFTQVDASSQEQFRKNIDDLASTLSTAKDPDLKLIDTLKSRRFLKEKNLVVFTGDPTSLKTISDTVLPSLGVSGSAERNKNEFYLFQPAYQSPKVIYDALKNLHKELEASGLMNPDLMQTLSTMSYSEGNQHIVFTGTKESIAAVKELIKPLDTLSPRDEQIQKLGEQTFLIYKIKVAAPDQLVTTLTKTANDLGAKGALDLSSREALKSMQYIPETRSLVFTGSPEALRRVEQMLRQFDVADLGPKPILPHNPETFVVYTPKYQTGEDLILVLQDFGDRLVSSGVSKNNLLGTIRNVQWMPTTHSLIITGDNESIAKVEELLKRFDVPSKDDQSSNPSIESIEDTSFLIYKLQYHQGADIVTALKQIAVDLGKGDNTSNQNLLSAINSLQCINVTNSLLASGEAETLAKLKELIQNLDVPLRQVFIEVLVLETSLTNTQNFGLQWGGKMNFLNRFGAASGNFPLSAANGYNSSSTSGGITAPDMGASINGVPQYGPTPITPTSGPPPGIPFTSGFDLGILGDIIMHKGKSFLSLGSLVNALQTDTDSQVILNPKIITQDNRTSTIFVGNNVPFVGSVSQITGGSNSNTTSNIEYRDIGFNLTITPTIGNNDIVTLDISNDISEVIAPLQNSSQINSSTGVTGITSSHTTMATRVHVPDQHFVVLTGMIQDTKTHYKSQIPCLGGIPVIGLAFSENDRLDNKQNVIIFVRPHIVNTYQEYKEITEQQEVQFKDQAVLPIIKEEIDAGIDLVKTPENE